MSRQDYIKYKKAVEDTRKEISDNKDKAKDFLYSIGVLTKKGNPTKHFKDLCTLGKQA